MEEHDALSHADFVPLQGSTFRVVTGSGLVELKLNEISRLTHGERTGGAFSLVFVGAVDLHLDQASYHLKSDQLSAEIFLVPIGPFGDGLGYEAVFT